MSNKFLYILSLVFALSLLSSPVQAENNDTDPLYQIKREQVRQEIQERKIELQEEFGAKRAEIQQRIEEKRQELEKNRAEVQAKIEEKKQVVIGNITDNIYERLLGFIERLSALNEKIEERIARLEDNGVDTTLAKEKLVLAKLTVDTALEDVNDIKDITDEELKDLTSPSEIKALIETAKESVKLAKNSIVEVIKELKSSIELRTGSQDSDDDSDDSDDDSDDDSNDDSDDSDDDSNDDSNDDSDDSDDDSDDIDDDSDDDSNDDSDDDSNNS